MTPAEIAASLSGLERKVVTGLKCGAFVPFYCWGAPHAEWRDKATASLIEKGVVKQSTAKSRTDPAFRLTRLGRALLENSHD